MSWGTTPGRRLLRSEGRRTLDPVGPRLAIVWFFNPITLYTLSQCKLLADSFAGRSAESGLPRLAGLQSTLPASTLAALQSAWAVKPHCRQEKSDCEERLSFETWPH